MVLDPGNRWVKLRDCIPWDELAESYHKTLSSKLGHPIKDARIVIDAVIIKHKLSVSDEETDEQIPENPYLQYFIGLKGFQSEAPFASPLLVDVRKRMGQAVFDRFHEVIIEGVIADKAYGSRDNRRFLEQRNIRFAGKLLGRPPKTTPENKDERKRQKVQRQQEYRERIPIEVKFGQGKNGYRLNNMLIRL